MAFMFLSICNDNASFPISPVKLVYAAYLGRHQNPSVTVYNLVVDR